MLVHANFGPSSEKYAETNATKHDSLLQGIFEG